MSLSQIRSDTDFEIIRSVLDGRIDDFEVLIERYQRYVFRIVGRHVPKSQVEEVAHEVFVDAYQALPKYKRKNEFRHWLGTIAVRRCHDYWRKIYKRKETVENQLSDETKSWLEEILIRKAEKKFRYQESKREFQEVIRWLLGKLSADDRMVLSLIYLEGYSVAEAAQALGWSRVKVKVRAFRARKQLRNSIPKAKHSLNTP